MKNSVTTSYSIPKYLKEGIEKKAKELERSASWVVAKAVAKYLELDDAEKSDNGGNGQVAGNIGA